MKLIGFIVIVVALAVLCYLGYRVLKYWWESGERENILKDDDYESVADPSVKD